MEITLIKVSEIKEYDNNPRNNEGAVDKVADSIKNFGFKVPIVVDKNNVIVSGHTRVKAAVQLGIEEVPSIVASDLTEEQIKAFRIADNRVAEESDWDYFKLADELSELKALEMDFELTGLGFDESELEGILELSSGTGYDNDEDDDYDYYEDDEPVSTFRPKLDPNKDNGEITDEDFKRASERMKPSKTPTVNEAKLIACPHCGKEFEAKV